MCGIVGYIGKKQATPILIEGLRRLEYRGYDSAGIAVFDGGHIVTSKALGQVKFLAENANLEGRAGIGHTRWATHGGVTIPNTHPHTDVSGNIAVVHNGIIENYAELRNQLTAEGVTFLSETDTEVIPHLIRKHYKGDLLAALLETLPLLRGTYGIAVVSSLNPRTILVARNGSPIVIGVGKGENWVASDPSAFAQHTREVVYLEDGDVASVTMDCWEIEKHGGSLAARKAVTISEEWVDADKGNHPHFMLKEIYEQPMTLRRCMTGRLLENTAKLGGINLTPREIVNLQHLGIVSCGTSYHAGLVAAHAFEELAGLRTNAEIASELRYRNPPIGTDDLYLGVSQSGETADTLHALRMVKSRGAHVAGVINVVGSTIARECGQGVYIHSGPEQAVASTKAFTSQVTALLLTALSFGTTRGLSSMEGWRVSKALATVPDELNSWFASGPEIVREVAWHVYRAKQTFFIGRGVSAPVAMEGALKLKEISYIPSFAYPSGEMKHGPIALIDNETPLIAIVPKDQWRDKTVSNIIEAKARGAKVISVADALDEEVEALSDHFIPIPRVGHHLVSPLLTVIPLQLLAYEVANLLGRDIDRPRNLAKSVTVE
jgi:glucosamine--fructose-6-phosphate aminotransferase (isomerizing)